MLTMAASSNRDSISLEIRTKSIEKTLVPLVNQITTLVNAREKPIKSERTLKAIVRVGQTVNFAVQKFVAVGEAIADDNAEIKADMYEACKDARSGGALIEKICDVKQDYTGHIRTTYADKNNIVRAARTLLSSVTRVLLLADTVIVKQILVSKNRVSISLNRLEHASTFTEFVKSFSQFGSEMVELAHLTGDRQNDLKDERRRSQMAVARQILERSTMMLLTSSKVCFRHPECVFSRDNRDAIFLQMRQAIDLIYFVTKDGTLAENNEIASIQTTRTPHHPMSMFWTKDELERTSCLYNAIKQFEDIVEIIRMTLVGPPYREKLLSSLDSIADRTQDFTDSAYTSHGHREKIIHLCDRLRRELNQLLRVGAKLDQAGCTSPTADLEAAILQVLRATKDLKQELQDASLDHAHELLKLFEDRDNLKYLKTISVSGDCERLEEYSEKFLEYADHVQDACKLLHHVSTTESAQVASKNIESCLRKFAIEILNACRTVSQHPLCEISKENLDVFLDMWSLLCQDVISIYKEISELCRRDSQYRTAYLSLPRPGKHGTTSKQLKPAKLDVEEQAKIAKLGLEMKLLTSEIDAETEKWSTSENDLCKRAKTMSRMAFSMYQFTRGEGSLNTTQDLFTQAEFFAEEANKLYKFVRQFSYQVPSGSHKNELLEYLDKVPTFVQQLQFTVKNPTVGKAATFTKVDNVIQETKNLMNVISKVVTTCLFCSKTDADEKSRDVTPSVDSIQNSYDRRQLCIK